MDPPVLIVAGGRGWRMLSVPAEGVTVDDLAALNLVQGVPGYYPTAGPNLYTGYDGTAYSTPGAGAVLRPGYGFWWLFYNQDLAPEGPSRSYALPTTLETERAATTGDVPVALHADGDQTNLLGNPFGVGLDVSAVGSWPGASRLASTIVQTWNAAGSTYEPSVLRPVVAPWEGFWAEGATAGTLTIPASARTTGGPAPRAAGPAALIAFELASADGTLVDRAAVLTLAEDALAGHDPGDAIKVEPVAAAHVLLAFAGDDGLRAVENRPAEAAMLPMAVASVGAGADLVLTWPRVENLPDGWAATLRDTQTGTTVDLATADQYTFAVAPTPARAAATEAVPIAARAAAFEARFVLAVGPRGATASEGGSAAGAFALDAPRPNPTRGTAMVAYELPSTGPARLVLLDLLGREVAVLAEGEQAAGRHTAAFDVSGLAPGVYVVRLSAGAQTATRRVVVVR